MAAGNTLHKRFLGWGKCFPPPGQQRQYPGNEKGRAEPDLPLSPELRQYIRGHDPK